MTEYSDIPQVNMLHAECEKVDAALKMIDDQTGTMTAFTIGPLPLPPGMIPTVMQMAVQILLPNPAQQSTMTEIRAQLVTYQQSLLDQLTQLGVTSPPSRAA